MKDRFGIDWKRIAEDHGPGSPFWRRPALTRRNFFRHASGAVGGYFLLPELNTETIARAQPTLMGTAKNCIFILMRGGPSHIDTFDLKEGSWTPRELEPTTFGNIRWPRGLMPKLADQMDSIALVRSVKAWALVHGLAQVWAQIGRNPVAGSSKIAPHIGSVAAIELSGQQQDATLPAFVSLNVTSGIGQGYLPPENAPFFSVPNGSGLGNSRHNDGNARYDRRYGLLLEMDSPLRSSPELGAAPYQTGTYNLAARKLVYNSKVDEIFTFDAQERTRYGTTNFGNSCIAARNMLRARSGARFIQITTTDWDHHDNIWGSPTTGHYLRAREFDPALAALIEDLKSDGLLNETLIVAMGEFGRTVGNLTATRGRDHLAQQAVLFAGGGIRGGRVLGSSNAAGNGTAEPGWSGSRDIRAEDIEATMYSALGIDWTTIRRDDPLGRGFEYVPGGAAGIYKPIHELWT
ncbi:MAG: DUF1501 domain-containing protein [Acidimicrobiia bacterium]|nr:DUF1501 domain-containing protein [Acidimicrobiia bacterium]